MVFTYIRHISVSGTLGPDIVKMVDYFVNGKTYEMEKVVESQGQIKVVIGTVSLWNLFLY